MNSTSDAEQNPPSQSKTNASLATDAEGQKAKKPNEGRSTLASRLWEFWKTLPGFVKALAALIGAIAVILPIIRPHEDPEYNTPVLKATGDLTTRDDWQFRSFDGGDDAAAHLSLPSEQPRPENIYATLVAPDDKRNWILVWWKRDRSGFTYNYTDRGWDKHNPANFTLPLPKNHEIPISLGGRGYQKFLFFQATPAAASAAATQAAPK